MKRILTIAILLIFSNLFCIELLQHYPMNRLNDFEFFQSGILINASQMEDVEYYLIDDSLSMQLQYTISIPEYHYLQKFCLNDTIMYGCSGICGRDRDTEFYAFSLTAEGYTELSATDIQGNFGFVSYFSPMIYHNGRVIFKNSSSHMYHRVNVEDSYQPFLEEIYEIEDEITEDQSDCNHCLHTYQDTLIIASIALGTGFNGNFRILKNTDDTFDSMLIGGENRCSYTYAITSIGSTLFLSHLHGLIVYDISDLENIEEVFFYSTDWGRSIIALEEYIVLGADDGFYVFRYNNQYAMQFIEHYVTDGRVLAMKLRPGTDELWCSLDNGDSEGLMVMDVSELLHPQSNPVLINVPQDMPTIQAAIDIACDGDTILVQPGVYYENINFNGKRITVGSLFLTTQETGYISDTVIDGSQNDSVVRFINGENSQTVFSGFTLRNGFANNGGAINCCNSSPILDNLIITENSGGIQIYDGGGGIHLSNSNAVLENLLISNNESFHSGGGVYCRDNSAPTFSNVEIINNIAYNEGGGMLCRESNIEFENGKITGNTCSDGGGISCFLNMELYMNNTLLAGNNANRGAAVFMRNNCSAQFINTTFSGNSANDYAGAIFCRQNSHPILINSILWNDLPQEIYLVDDDEESFATLAFCDIQQGLSGIVSNNGVVNWLQNNIEENPLLNWNYYLNEDSPCIDAGTDYFELDEQVLVNILPEEYYGSSPDMGAYEFGMVSDDECKIENVKCKISNYPNPFNPSTTITFSINENSLVNLSIYNIKGQKIITLANENYEKGKHSIEWNGCDKNQNSISSGIYICKIKSGKHTAAKTMLLLK